MASFSRNTYNNAVAKQLNRVNVLKLVATNHGISRVDLARLTSLSKMSLSNITNFLIEQNIIEETDLSDRVYESAGRRPIGLAVGNNSPLVIGIWISRDCCSGVLTDISLKTLGSMQLEFTKKETADSLIRKVCRVIKALLESTDRRVCGVGISSIGPIDANRLTILNPPGFYGITNTPIGKEVYEQFNLPVYMHNDMNASALAEKYYGNGREIRDFVYVGISNGVGAGIIWNDQLFEGKNGFAGEFGHATIDRYGEICHCGNRGCLEIYTNTAYMIRKFEEEFGHEFKDFYEVTEFCGLNLQAMKEMDLFAEVLSIGLINLCNIVDPAYVVIGHYGVHLPERTLSLLKKHLNAGVLSTGHNKINVIKSAFGEKSPIMGAVSIVVDKIFRNELNIFQEEEIALNGR